MGMIKMQTTSAAPAVTGRVTLTARDARGRYVGRVVGRNTYTQLGATDHAKLLAGEAVNPPSLALSHISLSPGGPVIADCDSAAGWSVGTTLDSVNYKQGVSALYGASTANSATTFYNQATRAAVDCSATGSIEVWVRVLNRTNTDLAESQLIIFCGGNDAWVITFASLEAIKGSPFQDGTWALLRIPTTSFVAYLSPSWAAATGVGFKVAANANGTATVHIDDVRFLPSVIDTSSAATSVPYERSKRAVATLARVGRIATATAFWIDAEAVGQVYVLGLYANAGATLVAIFPLAYFKAPAVTLTATWSLTTNGG